VAFTWRRGSDECHLKHGTGTGGVPDEYADTGRRHDTIDEANHTFLKLK
jgi:hypothetical protein